MQRVLNCAARVVARVPKYEHITPVLASLHWLPIPQRIEFKLLLLTFKALNGLAPSYLQELVHIYKPARPLRSQNETRITLPKYRTKCYGANSFKVYGAITWNNLPVNIRNIDSLPCFKRAIKTHLFQNAYGL